MKTSEMIAVSEFCFHNKIEVSFIIQLNQAGLVPVELINGVTWVHADNLPFLEKLVNFHYEMDINIAGIEAIVHLLQKMEYLHRQLREMNGTSG